MENLLYFFIAIACVVGFVIAWLLKKSYAPQLRLVEAELELLKTKAASLETEKTYLQHDTNAVKEQLQQNSYQLEQSREQATAYHTRWTHADELLASLKLELTAEKEKHWSTMQQGIQASNDKNRLGAELRFKEEQLANQQKQLEAIGQKFEGQFKILAQEILEEKTKSFHLRQEESLQHLLNPLKENIKTFKQEFETRYTKESEERISLREQIRHMMELNNTLSTQANNLTNALRGQVKQQGNWGEMILESILDHAGLQKGMHYFVQEKNTGEDGQTLLPDVVIRYPDGRNIVIDSKVSLLHYEQYSIATDEGSQRIALNLLQQSVMRHIEGLSSKKYAEAVQALDFVMMFIPVEGAYITMMQANPQLWQHAYKKRVLLLSPTNLIAAMKLVYDLWKRDGINQNAQEIAEKAVKIYEKLAAFVEDFEKVGSQLERAANSFTDAKKKLYTGKGNLISQASQMKQKVQHTSPVRDLPTALVTEAESEEEREQPKLNII
jgi:DNA recombination protein RmuC